MDRIPDLEPDALSAQAREVHDEIVETRGEIDRPFRILLASPEVLRRVGHLGRLMRYDSELTPALRECVILATARELHCRFEWDGHEPQAREVGVSDATIAAIAAGRVPDDAAPEIAAAVGFAQAVLRSHSVGDGTFEAVRTRLGERGTAEVAATVGYYAMLATVVNAYEPDGGQRLRAGRRRRAARR